jgi:hypothetical protein
MRDTFGLDLIDLGIQNVFAYYPVKRKKTVPDGMDVLGTHAFRKYCGER